MAVVGIAVAGAGIVVVLHRLPVEDTQEQEEAGWPAGAVGLENTAGTVVQQEIVAPCPLDDPVHIASHSNSAVPEIPALADLVAVAVVLRFPLYLLYTTRSTRFIFNFCS